MLYLAVIFPMIAYLLPTENKKAKLLISVAPAIFIILFRFGLGTDYFSYEYLYNNHNISSFLVAIKSQAYAMEPGFRLMIYAFRSLGLPYQVFVASISLTIYLLFIKWLVDSKQNTPLAIMLFNGMFFVVWTLGALRQGLALAIGTYLFFNKEEKLNTWQSILVILILGQFHAAAYLYFILLLVKKIDFNRKTLIIILSISLLSTLLPMHYLLKPFEDIRIVSKVFKYLTPKIGFWDFAGLIRLTFVSFLLLFYDLFSKNKYIKHLTDMSVIGFSLYYLFKISEITASRVNIFTFVLIIPLFVYFISNLKISKILYSLSLISVFLFSMVYLEKDLLNHQYEVGKRTSDNLYKLVSIHDVNLNTYSDYNNKHAYLTQQQKFCHQETALTKNIEPTTTNKGYYVIKQGSSGLYGVFDDQGEWYVEPSYKKQPKLLEEVIITNENYYDLNNNEINVEPNIILELEEKAEMIKAQEPKEKKVSYANYQEVLKERFPFEESVYDTVILNYKLPFEYNILKINYFNKDYYFFLDDDLKIKNISLLAKKIKFDINNIAKVRTLCGYVLLNSNGDVIYQYKS